MAFSWLADQAITGGSPDPLFPRAARSPAPRAVTGRLGLLSEDPGQVDAGADVQLAEDLAEVERHGVRAQEHLGGALLVGQALGDQVGDGALGIGEARPPALRALGVGGMPAPDADPAQPAANPPAITQGRSLVVAGQRVLEPPPGLLEVLPADQQHAEVLRRGCASPRIG